MQATENSDFVGLEPRRGRPCERALRYSNIRAIVADAVFAVRPNVLAAWIYGSVARGEDRPDSDLDIAVVSSPEKLESALQEIRETLVTHGEELGFNPSVVGLTPEDVARLSSMGDPWWKGVEADALASSVHARTNSQLKLARRHRHDQKSHDESSRKGLRRRAVADRSLIFEGCS